MKNLRACFCTMAILSALTACTSVPDFSDPSDGDQTGVSVQDIVEHIRCELQTAANDQYPYTYDQAMLKDFDAYVVLNLKVDDSGNLLPSTSFIQPYTTTTNRALGISLQYGEARERTFTQGYLFRIGKIAGEPLCQDDKEEKVDFWAPHLRGDLGLNEIARIGLTSIGVASIGVTPASFGSGSGYYVPQTQTASPPPGPPHPGAGAAATPPSPPTVPSPAQTLACNPATPTLTFGSSMQFALTKGFGGGPSWTLTHFKFGAGGSGGGGSGGSSGGSSGSSSSGGGGGGPINVSRIDTDQLWITFAPDPDARLTRLNADLQMTNKSISDLDVSMTNEKSFSDQAVQQHRSALLSQRLELQNKLLLQQQNAPAERANAACAFSSAVPTMIFQSLSAPSL